MMIPVAPIYLVPLILDHHNISKKKTVINLLLEKKRFQLIFDSIQRLQFEANSETISHSSSSSNLLFKREEKNTLIQNETLLIEDCLSEAFIESTNNNKDAQHFDDCLPNPKKMKHCNKAEQQNCFKNCSKSRTEKNV